MKEPYQEKIDGLIAALKVNATIRAGLQKTLANAILEQNPPAMKAALVDMQVDKKLYGRLVRQRKLASLS